MSLSSNRLRLTSALLVLVAANGCSLADETGVGDVAGGSGAGGSTGNQQTDEIGYEVTEGAPAPTAGADPGSDLSCDNGVVFEIAPNATHSRVSAAFAVAALDAGTWPAINRSLLRHDEFLAYFAKSDISAPFARVRVVDDHKQLDVFVTVPPDDASTHLILVVDTSTSMRNDLPLAGEIVSGLATALAANAGDHLTVVEWGSDPRVFTGSAGSTVPASAAAELGAEFDAHARDLTKAQLGPGGSLGPAQAAVDGAIGATSDTPHIVVLTDGGVEADGDAFAAIESWATKSNAVISFIEIAGGSEGAMAEPRSFHREQLASMAIAGGGLSHFVTHATLGSFLSEFDGSIRIGRRDVRPRYDMPGVVALLSSPEADFAAGELGGSSLPRWSGVGRPVFTSVGVETCSLPEFGGTVTLDGKSYPVQVGDAEDYRVARLDLIDRLFEILRQDCAAATPLIEAFGVVSPFDDDLRALVDRAATLCLAEP